MIVKKANIIEHLAFTMNVEDKFVNPHIVDAQKYDLLPYIGNELFTKLELVCADYANWQGQWSVDTAYLVNQKVIHGNSVWKCLIANTGEEPTTVNVNWQLQELDSFWYFYVKPYMAFNVASRFPVTHGKNFTQYGIVKPFEPTSQPAEGKEVGNIINLMEDNTHKEFTFMDNKLEEMRWKFDNVQYTKPSNAPAASKKKSFGIKAID